MTASASDRLRQGLTFLDLNARLLERRLAQLWFTEDTPQAAHAVLDALGAYRNTDGGLGFALEPDVRDPGSQPVAVDFGLSVAAQIAETVGGADPQVRSRLTELAQDLVSYLEQIAEPDGGLRIIMKSAAQHPRAEHWGDCDIPAGVNPTAGVVTRLRSLGATGTWLDTAETYSRAEIDRIVDDGSLDAHSLDNVLRFLAGATDTDWAQSRTEAVRALLPDLTLFHMYPGEEGYGLSPLDLVPSPEDPHRALFPAEAIDAHLDALAAQQQTDGGWPLNWNPTGPAAEAEWRGSRTVHALRTLALNGR